MDIKKFVLSYYKNAKNNFHVEKLSNPTEAQKLHEHPYFQVYYMLKGSIAHFVENGKATLVAGDVFILPPSVPHYIKVSDNNAEFYSISFMQEFLKSGEGENKLISDFLYYLTTATEGNIQPKFAIPHADTLFCQTIFNRINLEFYEGKSGSEELIRECLNALLTLFARIYFEQKQVSIDFEANTSSVLHCLEYIKNHLDEDVSLNDMAKKSAMSKSNFCKVFYSVAGKSFKDFVNSSRIEKATELIERGENFTSVCRICGYNDFSTFFRNFRKYTGLSPTEFKKRLK